MNEMLDALYRIASESSIRSYWLFNEDFANSYANCRGYAERERKELEERLTHRDRELFKRYMDNMEEQTEHERHILFNQGLSMGIMLASMGR